MNIPKYITPKSNRFVVDCDLILEYATNSDKYLNRPFKKNINSFEEVLFDASGYTLNTSKLHNYYCDYRSGSKKNAQSNNEYLEFSIFNDFMNSKFPQTDGVKPSLASKNGRFRPIRKKEIINKVIEHRVNDFDAIFSRNKNDYSSIKNKIHLSQKDISNNFYEISDETKVFDEPENIENPLTFFSKHATFSANKFVIFDPHFFSDEDKSNKTSLMFGFNKNCKAHEDGRYVRYMVNRLMFYFKWIDQICTNPSKLKIYFISQIPVGYSSEFFYRSKIMFEQFTLNYKDNFKFFDKLILREKDIENVSSYIYNKENDTYYDDSDIKLYKNYMENHVSLLTYDKSEKNSPFREKLLKVYGADKDHRNFILTDYCDIYWDLRKRFIKTPHISEGAMYYTLGEKKESQTVNINSIFNRKFIQKPNMWKNLFEVANMMIYEGREEEKKYNSEFIDRIKEKKLSQYEFTMINILRREIPSFKEYINEIKNN